MEAKIEVPVMLKLDDHKIRRAILYTCNDYSYERPSRNNEANVSPMVFEGPDHRFVLEAFAEFASSRVRRRLVLELENGREIGFMPVLRPGYSATSPVIWDVAVDVWPR